MNKHITSRRLGALTFSVALLAGACGSDGGTADTPVSTEAAPSGTAMSDESMDDDAVQMDENAMGDMSATSMNMGDADATAAEAVEGAALSRGEFALLDTRPSGYDDVAGTAVMARSDTGTTVTTQLTGLLPDTVYVSHVHESPCSDNGGAHFQFVDGTVEVPPNEIHLLFTSDGDGNGFMTAENDAVTTVDAVAFVVHPVEFIDNKIACVDFVADDPAAVEAAIESGPKFDPSTIDGMDGMNMSNTNMSAMGDE